MHKFAFLCLHQVWKRGKWENQRIYDEQQPMKIADKDEEEKKKHVNIQRIWVCLVPASCFSAIKTIKIGKFVHSQMGGSFSIRRIMNADLNCDTIIFQVAAEKKKIRDRITFLTRCINAFYIAPEMVQPNNNDFFF